MKTKFKQISSGKRILLGLVIFIVLIPLLYMFFAIIREPYENDTMPTLLFNNMDIEMQKINEYPANLSDGKTCEGERITAYLNQDKYKEHATCKEFQLNHTKIFFVDYSYLAAGQKLLIQTPFESLLTEMIVVSGAYPGNEMKDIKADNSNIYFRYSGWHNPEKIIRLNVING